MAVRVRHSDQPPAIPRGNGLSHGDASTIHDGWILNSTKLKGFLLEGDTLTVGSGETISTTTGFLREFQYELAVVPGTGNVTIGGAISSASSAKKKQFSKNSRVLATTRHKVERGRSLLSL